MSLVHLISYVGYGYHTSLPWLARSRRRFCSVMRWVLQLVLKIHHLLRQPVANKRHKIEESLLHYLEDHGIADRQI